MFFGWCLFLLMARSDAVKWADASRNFFKLFQLFSMQWPIVKIAA